MKFSIPTPCHEDWTKMTPNEKGRHCQSCEKTVVDFSKMPNERISSFLTENRHKKLCGRAKSTQLNTPLQISPIKISGEINWTKTFLYASFVAFGLSLYSCKNHDNHVVGELSIDDSSITTTCDDNDYTQVGQVMMANDTNVFMKGDIMIEEISDTPTIPIIGGNIEIVEDFMGDIAIDFDEENVIDIKKDSICIKDTTTPTNDIEIDEMGEIEAEE